MNWNKPFAPTGLIACGSNEDSTSASQISSPGTPFSAKILLIKETRPGVGWGAVLSAMRCRQTWRSVT